MKKRPGKGDALTPRHQKILGHLIDMYISKSEPVGSRTIAEQYFKDLSAATVRNCLEEMERMGYLYKPHTSAGRMPTEKSFRYYVTELLKHIEEQDGEIEHLSRRFAELEADFSRVFSCTTRWLADTSHHTALVMLPKLDDSAITAVDFVKLSSNRIMVVVVFKPGLVENRIIETDRNFSQSTLAEYSRYINSLLERNMSLDDIRINILHEMRHLKEIFDRIFENVTKKFEEKTVLVEGQSNLFDNTEFSDVKDMKKIFSLFEEKSKIVTLLDKSLRSPDVTIYIGSSDLCSELAGAAMITAPYGSSHGTQGILGIIGPVRMDYCRMLPLVSSTARMLSKTLAGA